MNAIIKAAARAVVKKSDYALSGEAAQRIATAVLAAVTPLIEAQTLEQAAQVAELEAQFHEGRTKDVALFIAARVRAFNEQP